MIFFIKNMRTLLLLAIVLLIAGILLSSISLIYSHEKIDKVDKSIVIQPNKKYYIPYLSDSEIIFTYNFTSPVDVSGYPSSATLLNNSILYTICFFSSNEGNLTLYNPYNSTALVGYILEEASMSGVIVEYSFILGIIMVGSGVFTMIYTVATKKNHQIRKYKK
jgi:ABC-type multidrug transport system fused ATPase/permease subunit